MSSQLANKVAVITGSSTGIGAGIAKAFAAAGASVVVNYQSNKSGGEAVVSDILASGGKAVTEGRNISRKAEAQALIDAAIKNFGRLDILVNNAALTDFGSLEEVSEEAFRRVFETNVLGTLFTIQAALKHLKAGASIINIGTAWTRHTPPNGSLYVGTKGAIDSITSVLANELGPRQIRVNVLKPALTLTEKAVAFGIPDSNVAPFFLERTPLGRLGTVEDIASVAVFLASDASAWITGQHIHATGGF